jgi:protease-4
MKKLLKSKLFWILVGCLVLLGVVVLAAVAMSSGPDIKDHSYLVVDIRGDILEFDPPADLASGVLGSKPETLQRILCNLEKAAADERIDGVILKISSSNGAGYAMMQEIRGAIAKVQARDKKVYGLIETVDSRTYYLAAACDSLYAYPDAYISFTGFAATTQHVKQSLDKLGIKPNISKIKDYKAAAEMVTTDRMSDASRENKEWLLAEIWEMYTEALAGDRGFSEEQVTGLMAHALFSPEEAIEAGLVDELLYWDGLEEMLKQEDDDELRTVSQGQYAEVDAADLDIGGKKKIAVVHAQGMIGGRKSRINPLLGVMMGSDSVACDLRKARLDDDIAAVVFRVDSRGGDSLTSGIICHEVELVRESKPIIASMVNVAASGGYKVSYRASKVIADPMTITGSIGSISGKLNMKGLYDRLGMTFDSATMGPMAQLYSDTRDFTEAEWARFQENHWDGFNRWLEDVAKHRGMGFEEAEKLAHGRVWTGRQAKENGLIDELGGLDRAVELAKELAEIPADEQVTLVHYPKKKSMMSMLLGNDSDRAALVRTAVYQMLREDINDTRQMLNQQLDLMDEMTIQ